MKIRKYEAGRWLLLVALACFWIIQLKPQGIRSSADFQTVQNAVTAAADPEVYPIQDRSKMSRYLSVEADDFADAVLLRKDDAMSGSEIWLARFDSDVQKEAFSNAAQARKDSQKQIYDGYAPDQADILDKAVIDVENNYGLYAAGENAASIQEAFINALKGAR